MGPFRSKIRNVFRKLILQRVNTIILRDDLSRKYLQEQLGLDAYVTADSAAQNDVDESYLNKYEDAANLVNLIKTTKFVGIVLTDLAWHPKYKNDIMMTAKIKSTFSYVISYLINRGYMVILIPHLFGKPTSSSLLADLQNINRKKIIVLGPEYDAYAQQVVISKLFCVIGIRYHSAVFAVKSNVPPICIYYEHKAKSFMDMMGLSNFAIDVDVMSANAIIERFIYLESNYCIIVESLKKTSKTLKKNSRRTTKIIAYKARRLGLIK